MLTCSLGGVVSSSVWAGYDPSIVSTILQARLIFLSNRFTIWMNSTAMLS